MSRPEGATYVSTGRGSFGLSLVLCIAFWALARWLQIKWVGLGFGYDVGLYQTYGRSWGSGQIPYVDFHPEYPPGAIGVFVAAWLSGGMRSYSDVFAYEMAVFDVLALAGVVAWARRLYPDSAWAGPLLGLTYVVFTGALYPVLYTRFDLVPGALVLLATYFLYVPRQRALGGFLLGLAAAVKLWPLALVPLFGGLSWRRGGWIGASKMGIWITFGVLLPAVGIIPYAHERVLEFLDYHAARGIQIESTWASLALALHQMKLADVQLVHEFGAFHVRGRLGDSLAAITTKATVLLALVPQVVAFLGGLGQAADARARLGLSAACAATVGFMIGGKVLSPQYMMWLVPLLVPALQGPLRLAGGLAAAVLTTVVYPYLSPALELQAPGHGWALLSVGTRNLLLVMFYSMLIAACAGRWKRVMRRPHSGVFAPELPVSAGGDQGRRALGALQGSRGGAPPTDQD